MSDNKKEEIASKTVTLALNNDEYLNNLDLESLNVVNEENGEITTLINKVKIVENSSFKKEITQRISCGFCDQKMDVSQLPELAKFKCPQCQKLIGLSQEFANFSLKEIVGIGGMAIVYKAYDEVLNRFIAIKVLNKALLNNAEHKELFFTEAQMVARLNHNAILPIYLFDHYKDEFYIVMPFMDNGSLKNKVFSKKMTVIEAESHYLNCLTWMQSIAEGLVYSLRHGIIHHDIKPGNILLDKLNNVHLADFGLAQIFKKISHRKKSMQFWLSPHYTSPEKVMYRREDYRGDIYSLGATFYHLLTGHTPFAGKNIDIIITARFEHKPKKPRSFNKFISRKLSKLLLRMLYLQPSRRPEYSEIIAILNEEILQIQEKNFKNNQKFF
ncbi:serine/threonine-protein kinase [Lentisphaerota bacterium WC36G]|nr:serine/threonine protein kinase [Lentisphaerae bacterium WC36]